MSTLAEFQTDPETDLKDNTTVWYNKMTVDLRWVAGATPFGKWTGIIMAGGGPWITINAPYPDFMAQWQAGRPPHCPRPPIVVKMAHASSQERQA